MTAGPTIREILARSEAWLSEKGVDSPRLSAQLLVAEALGLDRMGLFLDLDRPLAGAELDRIRPLITRRGSGEPAAYILGRREFHGLDFTVTPAVLIPRPETEHLLEEAVRIVPRDKPFLFADLGTGSGILAVTAATLFPLARGIAIDLSTEALAVARENAVRHAVQDRILFARADFSALPVRPASLALVLANPPYLAEAEVAELSPEVSRFEPRSALVAGAAGDEAIRAVASAAFTALLPGGTLLMEIGWSQGAEAGRRFVDGPEGWTEVRVLKDLAGHDRVLSARRPP